MNKKIVIMISVLFVLIFMGIMIPEESNYVHAVSMPQIDNNAEIQEDIDGIISEIEEELMNNQTSVVSELQSQIEKYSEMLSTSNFEDQEKILELISATGKMISGYENYKANQSSLEFGDGPMVVQPAFIDFHVVWTPAIAAITAGFTVEGWYLAAELLTFMTVNHVFGTDYKPLNKNVVAWSSHIRSTVANSNEVVAHETEMAGPAWWGYLPLGGVNVVKADGDVYNSLGQFTYKKTYYDNTNVNITIRDLYNYSVESYRVNKIKAAFVNTCAMAQNDGYLIPFYTVIEDIVVPGSVPFNHEVQNGEVVITGHGNVEEVTIPDTVMQFGFKHLTDDNHMPNLPVKKIGSYAFANSPLSQITIPSSVTTIGANAFLNTNNAKIYLSGRTSAPSTFHENWNPSANPVYLNSNQCTHSSKSAVDLDYHHHKDFCNDCRTFISTTTHNFYTSGSLKICHDCGHSQPLVHVHSYNSRYEDLGNSHKLYCVCGMYIEGGHVGNPVNPGDRFVICIKCNYRIDTTKFFISIMMRGIVNPDEFGCEDSHDEHDESGTPTVVGEVYIFVDKRDYLLSD